MKIWIQVRRRTVFQMKDIGRLDRLIMYYRIVVPKVWPMTSSISDNFVRNANFRRHPKLTKSETKRVREAQKFSFNKAVADSGAC